MVLPAALILDQVLVHSADLPTAVNASSLSAAYAANATTLKARFNDAFWDAAQGMYFDNTTTSLAPQDANSLAVLYNLTATTDQKIAVSKGLQKNWNDLGPVAPELPDTISPFISGFEASGVLSSAGEDYVLTLTLYFIDRFRHTSRQARTRLRSTSSGASGDTCYTRTSACSPPCWKDSPPTAPSGTLFSASSPRLPAAEMPRRAATAPSAVTTTTRRIHHMRTAGARARRPLTFYVLGLSATAPQGRQWAVKPHPSGLAAAEGGFTTALGWYGAKWTAEEMGMVLDVDTPVGTAGEVVLPLEGQVTIDGENATAIGGVVQVMRGRCWKVELNAGKVLCIVHGHAEELVGFCSSERRQM